MQKRILWFALILSFAIGLQVNAQSVKEDSTKRKWFVGSTLFLLGNLTTTNPPNFGQLNIGYRMSKSNVISLELITWKYAWPLGINPFFNNSYGKQEEKFPGYIREFGAGIAYQHFVWRNLFAAIHVMPMVQSFYIENGNKVDNGFHIFNTYRIGYHINLFKSKLFIQPSLGIAGRPYHTEMPDAFKQKDDKWSKWTPEPGLHFGFNL